MHKTPSATIFLLHNHNSTLLFLAEQRYTPGIEKTLAPRQPSGCPTRSSPGMKLLKARLCLSLLFFVAEGDQTDAALMRGAPTVVEVFLRYFCWQPLVGIPCNDTRCPRRSGAKNTARSGARHQNRMVPVGITVDNLMESPSCLEVAQLVFLARSDFCLDVSEASSLLLPSGGECFLE